MNAPVRTFAIKEAVREKVPLLIGLMGPSGGGKTFSALRLATGIQSVTGGDIHFIDTEARRALHYADRFKFKHIQFDAPFGSLDYLAAIDASVKLGAGVVIVDSLSHEHDGPGGMLDYQDHEATRLSGGDDSKRERVKMLAWAKPKAARRRLISGLLQMNCNFIFCFRAKETAKPVKRNGKTEVEQQGFMPIAGDEFVFEMTLNCLLLPRANGVPTWFTEQPGEKVMMKLPAQFEALANRQSPLDEGTGKRLAEWAKGSSVRSANEEARTFPEQPQPQQQSEPAVDPAPEDDPPQDDAPPPGEDEPQADEHGVPRTAHDARLMGRRSKKVFPPEGWPDWAAKNFREGFGEAEKEKAAAGKKK